jgi:LytS/YehU family sensor histidine kinase
MALRAQMNPHFIFNSLNSIQECIVKEKVEDAHKYLSRFSMLLRMVIDYSERSFISLEDEIKFLKLYLGLESLRFGESFSYEIFISPEVDEEETIVPSLLIQPFVENAIWHGLLHKNGKRELKISFINRNNEQLVCVVEDNGIGRVKSAKIKSSKLDAQSHESKGMRISQERIDLLRLQTHLNPEIVIEDLYDEYNNAAGTRVSVALPLELEVTEIK